jgi:hypothetical protein
VRGRITVPVPAERVSSETASLQGDTPPPRSIHQFYISKPAIAADVEHVLQKLSEPSASITTAILRE